MMRALLPALLLTACTPAPSASDRVAAARTELADQAGLPVLGARDPDLVITVFTDHRCQHCRRLHAALERLLDTDPGVRIVYRLWPILGPDSAARARRAIAAYRQGRFRPVNGALFGAAAPGLATTTPAIERQLAANAALARKLGLQGTPALVIGDRLIPGAIDAGTLSALVVLARRRPQQPPR